MKLICFLFYSFVFLFFPSVFPRLAAGHNVTLATLAILDGILAGYFRIDKLRFSVGLACVLINLPVTRDMLPSLPGTIEASVAETAARFRAASQRAGMLWARLTARDPIS